MSDKAYDHIWHLCFIGALLGGYIFDTNHLVGLSVSLLFVGTITFIKLKWIE